MVVPCIGERVDPEAFGSLVTGNYFAPQDVFGRLEAEGVFALGDARGDRGTVAEAIGDGRKAAMAVAAHLQGKPDPLVDDRPEMAAAS